MAYKEIHIKTLLKRQLLALTFVLGFFAFSGYFVNNRCNDSRVNTELLAAKSFSLKKGISYKRAALLIYKNAAGYFNISKNCQLGVCLYHTLIINRYQHLKQLYLFTKHSISYLVNSLFYNSDKYYSPSSFMIS